jgi:hypothetical protein
MEQFAVILGRHFTFLYPQVSNSTLPPDFQKWGEVGFSTNE